MLFDIFVTRITYLLLSFCDLTASLHLLSNFKVLNLSKAFGLSLMRLSRYESIFTSLPPKSSISKNSRFNSSSVDDGVMGAVTSFLSIC